MDSITNQDEVRINSTTNGEKTNMNGSPGQEKANPNGSPKQKKANLNGKSKQKEANLNGKSKQDKEPFKENISYLFIPFMMEEPFDFQKKSSYLKDSSEPGLISPKSLPSSYLFRYVAGKLDPHSEHCRCHSWQVTDALRTDVGIGISDCIHGLAQPRQPKVNGFYYQILDIQLYCFSTSVGILVYKLHFLNSPTPSDPLTAPMKLSGALFMLKDVCNRWYLHTTYNQDTGHHDPSLGLYDFSVKILERILCVNFMVFYQYQDAKRSDDHSQLSEDFRPRANILSYLDVPSRGTDTSLLEDYRKELYYLRHCYNETFTYGESLNHEEEETHCGSLEICWSFTSEAAICLTSREKINSISGQGTQRRHSNFIQNAFFQNFNSQYLLTYILLLHQKYAIYMFLTKIDTGIRGITATEKYKQDVHNFEMDFMFSHVSETPQYDSLYEKLRKIFALDSLYTDVLEPLQSLNEDRRQEAEDRRQEADNKTNNTLFIISVLSIFSALVDGYSLIGAVLQDNFQVDSLVLMNVLQFLFLIAIVVIYVLNIAVGFDKVKAVLSRFFSTLAAKFRKK